MGILGLKKGMCLPPPCNEDADSMTEEERSKRGIERLPIGVKERFEAVFNTESGRNLREAMGDELIRNIMYMNQADYEYFEGKGIEEEVRILLERY